VNHNHNHEEHEGHEGLFTTIDPPSLGKPRGFSHGLLSVAGSRLLFVAGQTAAGADGRVADRGFATQFDTALGRVLAVVEEAGGTPAHVGRMTVFVTNMEEYLASREALRDVWRRRMGRHYPAMALVEVTRLVDAGASVEIEATAVIA
jgi:enamine deaminase RidA (YjgF/YER057c/UK114 family)